MSVGEELRDPWGWLVAGVTGGLGWAVLASAAAGPVAVAGGLGIGAAVLGTKVAVGALRAPREPPERPRDRLPPAPRGSAQADLLDRSRAAIAGIDDLAGRPSDPWIADEVARVLVDGRTVLDAIAELAGRVTLLESSIVAARPNHLAAEIAALQDQMRRTTDEGVRREQQRALAALDGQAESVDRLLRRRDTLMAQLRTAAVGLEGLAARTGELVALGPASHDTDEASRIVADLSNSLDAVRAGIDEARDILRDL